MTHIKLTDYISLNDQAVLLNVLAYALKNWGNPTEEAEIMKIIAKIGNADDLIKSDAMLLLRVYSMMVKLFPNNKELQFEGISSLRESINSMQ